MECVYLPDLDTEIYSTLIYILSIHDLLVYNLPITCFGDLPKGTTNSQLSEMHSWVVNKPVKMVVLGPCSTPN